MILHFPSQSSDPPSIDLLDAGNLANPYPLFQHLLQQHRVHYDANRKYWIISGYEEISCLLKDSRLSANRYAALEALIPETDRVLNGYIRERLSLFMLNLDAPTHTRLRDLTKRIFIGEQVQRLRSRVQAVAQALLPLPGQGRRMDLVSEFAYPLPIRSICELIGLQAYDIDDIKRHSDHVSTYIGSAGLAPGCIPPTYESIRALEAIFMPVVAERRKEPTQDLISEMLKSEPDQDALSDAEIVANCILFLVAGFETVTNLIGTACLALFENQREKHLFIQKRDLCSSLIDETLRFYPPVNRTARLCVEDLEVAGQTIQAGEIVIFLLGAANRDPQVFPRPDSFELQREDRAKVLSFGAGPHHCLGHLLARLEGEVAIQTLFNKFPEMRGFPEQAKWRGESRFRGLATLPVEL